MSALLWGLTAEELFAGSLLTGFVFSLLAFPLASRRFHLHGKLAKLFGKRWTKAQTRFEALPGLIPASVAAMLVGFGFFGLVGRILLRLSVGTSLTVAVLGGYCFTVFMLWVLTKLFSGQAKPSEGFALLGLTCTVTLAIPPKGVGAISYIADGQRRTMPAKASCSDQVSKGSWAVIVNLENGVATIDEL